MILRGQVNLAAFEDLLDVTPRDLRQTFGKDLRL